MSTNLQLIGYLACPLHTDLFFFFTKIPPSSENTHNKHGYIFQLPEHGLKSKSPGSDVHINQCMAVQPSLISCIPATARLSMVHLKSLICYQLCSYKAGRSRQDFLFVVVQYEAVVTVFAPWMFSSIPVQIAEIPAEHSLFVFLCVFAAFSDQNICSRCFPAPYTWWIACFRRD